MNSTRHRRSEQPRPEMLQKSHVHETFFSLKGARERPVSVATEFMESDYDDDEILSDIEDGDNSPRLSLHSGQRSITTLSSYEEAQTPRSSRAPTAFRIDHKPVEGPRGPHLFRSSMLSAEYEHALSLSPITPKTIIMDSSFQLPIALDLTPLPMRKRDSGPFRFSDEELDTCTLPDWSPEMIAQWMLNAGIELQFAEKFVENDITGGIIITLKFEDLKELGISSFGVRTKVWEEIHVMREIKPSEPQPETPIDDEPDRAVRREQRMLDEEDLPKRGTSRRKKPKAEDIISPLESVSIVGIEQMMPKPHNCSKGENCSKFKRHQRMMEAFKNDHPFLNMDKGGVIMVAGDPGNPSTADSLRPIEDVFRPVSDAMPSVVASSDILGSGGLAPLQYLQEATLRNIQARDPQDNVRQFLDFQQHQASPDEVPPTPPFELLPQQHSPIEGLRSLPRLSIPSQSSSASPSTEPRSALRQQQQQQQQYQYQNQVAVESSPDITPTGLYRFGTPFSDMDVPVTAVPLGPVARDFSQSVPPDMNYRAGPSVPVRSMSRASARRPSFPVLPALDENNVSGIAPPRRSPSTRAAGQRPVAPPRHKYPWTQERVSYEKAIAPIPAQSSAAPSSARTPSTQFSGALHGGVSPTSYIPVIKDAEGMTYAGPMRKRKTKMLRHEWNDHFCTLKGTRLAVHKDPATVGRTLEYIDIDDYAIACSSIASSKLNAAFKAMHLRRNDDKADVAAFAFQLIPQDAKGGVKLRKRESAMPAPAPAAAPSLASGSSAPSVASSNGPSEGTNGTGKTHHFAVKNRDERIDWMRELMLAKALRQKGAGFEVSVNGNMI